MKNVKTSQYAWNSAPIDGTDIIWSIAAVVRNFLFPSDVDLSPTPLLNNEMNKALFNYLRNVITDSSFSLSILQILIEDKRLASINKHNNTK